MIGVTDKHTPSYILALDADRGFWLMTNAPAQDNRKRHNGTEIVSKASLCSRPPASHFLTRRTRMTKLLVTLLLVGSPG